MKRIKVIKRVFGSMTEAKASLKYYMDDCIRKGCKVLESKIENAETFLNKNVWCKVKFGRAAVKGYLIVLQLEKAQVEMRTVKLKISKAARRSQKKSFVILNYKKAANAKSAKMERVTTVVLPSANTKAISVHRQQYSLAA